MVNNDDISMKFLNKIYHKFDNADFFRFKLAFSLLTSTPIEITNIHSTEYNIGLQPYEICFLKLISNISNGSFFKINETGTSLKFIPGTITNNNGECLTFEADVSRNISYYLEGIFLISLFGKEKLNLNISGVTNNLFDISMDSFKVVIMSLLDKIVFGDTGNKIEIKQRCFYPNNSGEVSVVFPIIRFIPSLDLTSIGKIKKIGGHCFTNNCSQFSNRIIDKTRVTFNKLLNEVWIDKNTNINKGTDPGFSLSLWAQTTENYSFSYDLSYTPLNNIEENKILKRNISKNGINLEELSDPEILSDRICEKLLENILNVSII